MSGELRPELNVIRAFLLAPLLLFVGSGCERYDTKPKGPPASIETATFDRSLKVDLPAMVKTPTGLYYRDLTVGTGDVVDGKRRVAVHYVGSFPDGRVFDANQPPRTPYAFTPGRGEVIQGWDEGVMGMRVGGSRQLIIPAALGYGRNGSGPIPGGAILVFRVEIVSME